MPVRTTYAQYQELRGEYYSAYFTNREEFERWAAEARRKAEAKKE